MERKPDAAGAVLAIIMSTDARAASLESVRPPSVQLEDAEVAAAAKTEPGDDEKDAVVTTSDHGNVHGTTWTVSV